MDDKEREESIRALIEGTDLPELDGPKLRIIKFVTALTCGWDDCPEGLHRFLLHVHPETGTPLAVSLCIQDEDTGEIEQLSMSIPSALDLHKIVGALLGPLTLLSGLFPPDDE